ncbi:MAG: MATE family efflux transporter, partial [Reyranella sp.]|nr:MATE family efflux transporter [Reyranella sp.]
LHLVSRHALVRLQRRHLRWRRDEGREILRVGALSAASALLFQITTFLVAGLIAGLGSTAIAAYGAANRLELLQYPITFAFGSAVITMVATAAGARDFERARRAAWAGAAVAGAIGLVFSGVALCGGSWMGLFTADPGIRATGALYLLCIAAVFPLTGVGLACYFACLGVGYVTVPFLLAVVRVVIVVAGGWLALKWGGGLIGLSLTIGAALVLFGGGMFLAARSRFARLIRQ